MLNIEKPFEDGAMRLVRVQVNGQSALVTGRVNTSQRVVIISRATCDRLVKKYGIGDMRTLDSRCSSDWRVLISAD